MNLDQILQTFLVEAQELLQEMEASLLELEGDPSNTEAINAIFRAAHTIKGSAGMVGLEGVVAFTHVAENLLDRVRDGRISPDSSLIALLLTSRDHIGVLIEAAAHDRVLSEAHSSQQVDLLAQLNAYLGAPVATELPIQELAVGEASSGEEVLSENWHLSVRFGPDILRNGMDPAAILRYLEGMGDIVGLSTLFDQLPAGDRMDPESCYLGLEIVLRSQASKQDLMGAFDFVSHESLIRILPPRSKIAEYLELLSALPEETARLGEILVRIGALTPVELESCLQIQACPAGVPFETCAFRTEGADPCGRCQKDPALGCGYRGEVDRRFEQPLGQILVEQRVIQQPVVEAALQKQRGAEDNRLSESKTIRVEAGKLDHLINLIGELVIAGANTNLLAQSARAPALLEAASNLSRLVEEVRDSALKLRMVQIGATFSRFNRVVRDVSRELGKDIDLVITGGETELDKSVVEKIGDPLTHLVRNALDHGIERAEIRQAHGKNPRGTVRLNAYHDSGSIVIEVSDDGGGMDRERLLQKATERGLIAPGQILSDSEVYQLIFEPGFSTAEQITNLSGRGVGMDVVKRDITALRGTIELLSEPKSGSTVRIRLPLTLAIIDGFLVGVGNASYVVPLEMVVECVELSETDRQATSGRQYVNLRGEVLPFVRLRDIFGLGGQPGIRENIVVVQYGSQKAGLVVDELLGEFQTVIKPLGFIFSQLKGLAGSTILGSGEVALIVDVAALVQLAIQQDSRASSAILTR